MYVTFNLHGTCLYSLNEKRSLWVNHSFSSPSVHPFILQLPPKHLPTTASAFLLPKVWISKPGDKPISSWRHSCPMDCGRVWSRRRTQSPSDSSPVALFSCHILSCRFLSQWTSFASAGTNMSITQFHSPLPPFLFPPPLPPDLPLPLLPLLSLCVLTFFLQQEPTSVSPSAKLQDSCHPDSCPSPRPPPPNRQLGHVCLHVKSISTTERR